MLNSILQIRQQAQIRQQKTDSKSTTSNFCMNIAYSNLTNIKKLEKDTLKICFKGNKLTSLSPDLCRNILPFYTHETYFFRDIKTLDFIKKYVLQTFPKGTHIADFACSTGEETYSLATILMKHNKDKIYSITGYDIISEVVNKAKIGLLRNDYRAYEDFLTDESKVTGFNRPYKMAFQYCFEQITPEMSRSSITDDMIEKASSAILTETNKTKIEELKKILMFSHIPRSERQGTFVYPKPGVFDEIVNFKVGDIYNLDSNQLKLPKNTGVIMFKNAWYHLTGFEGFSTPHFIGDLLDDVSFVLDGIKKSLKDKGKGILVVGQLKRDHLFDSSQATRTIFQNGEKIEICDSTPFHDLLKEKGFKPVFYEQIHNGDGEEIKNGVYLPSVWKKGK